MRWLALGLQVAVVATLYYGTARMGFMIALPPGNVTALWPPSGIALAAIYTLGAPMAVGVWIGSFLVNLGSVSGASALPVAAAIATGSSVQALLAVFLLRRFIDEFPPATIRDSILSIGLIGSATLLAPLIGPASLCLAGLAAWENLPTLFITWWLGDFTGILVFAPVLILGLLRWRMHKTREGLLWPMTALIVGLAFFVFIVLFNTQQQSRLKDFKTNTDEITQLLQNAVDQEMHSITAIRAYLNNTDTLNAQNFSSFSRPLFLQSNAVSGYEWAPLVRQADRAAFEQAVRTGGHPEFQIYERDAFGNQVAAGVRDAYFPVTWIEPFASNQVALGYDLGSSPERMEAIAQARDSGDHAVTVPVHLFQEADHRYSVLMMLAVYRQDAPTMSLADRRANFLGVALGLVRVDHLIAGSLQYITRRDIELYLYDVTYPDKPLFMGFSPSISGPQSLPAAGPSALADLQKGEYQINSIQVGGRKWAVLARPGPAYNPGHNAWIPWLTLAIGLSASTAFLVSMSQRRRMENALARSESGYRLIAENINDVIWLFDLKQDQFVYISPSVEKLSGFMPHEMLGKSILDVLLPESIDYVNEVLPKRLAAYMERQENPPYVDELRQVHKNGSVVQVEVRSSFITAENGQVQLLGVSRDITERKQAMLLQETVYRIAEAAQSAISLEELYREIHRQISAIMYAENFYIALTEEDSGLLRFGYAVDTVNPPSYEPFKPGKGLTEYVIRTGRSLLCLEEDFAGYMELGIYERSGAACKVWLGAPLITHSKAIGAVAILNYVDGDVFSEREQHILEFVSSQIATAIERKQASEQLQKSRTSLEVAQSIARLGSWELDPRSGRGLMWSKEMFDLFHVDAGRGVPVLDQFMELVHPDDRQSLLQCQQRAIEGGELVSYEYRAILPTGEMRYFRANMQALLDEQRQLLYMSGTALDITESRAMQAQIQERVKELTCLFSVSRLLENRSQEIEVVCAEIVDALAPAMQIPELAAPLIQLDGKTYTARTGQVCANSGPAARIEVRGEERGSVCLNLLAQSYTLIPEEQDLIDNVARMLGLWLDQREAEAAAQAARRALEELNRDLERRVDERTAEVRRSEATYRALFENSNDGILLMAPDGSYVSANQRALDFLGYTQEEFSALSRTQSNPAAAPEQRADADQRFAAVLRGEIVPLYERTFIGKDGRKGIGEINLSAVRDPSGNVILVQSVVRDIAERKKAEMILRENQEKLSAANAALEKAARMKDEFLASMSHELRTPLTGILGLAEAMQLEVYGSLEEKQKKALANIEKSGRHLLELINDILDLSKIEAGKLDMQFDSCSLAEICQAALQLTRGMASQKKVQLSFSMQPTDIILRADGRRVKQMLVNLLSNAVKFSPEGSPAGLEVTGDEERKAVRLCVWDRGIGIKPEDMDKLFKPFTQIDSRLAREHAGTGLGLSLVYRMAELHGGSVQLESVFGEGTRVTLWLPWISAAARASQARESEPAVALAHTLTVEDNPLDAESGTRYLKELGINNYMHPTLEGAFRKVLELRPGAILLDLNLQDGDGLSLLAELKADGRTRDIPVIIVSVEERYSDAFRSGAAGYLVKPCTKEDLAKELAKVTRQASKEDPVMVIAPRTSTPLVMLADDNEAILGLLSDFLRSQNYQVIATRSGRELLDRVGECHPDLLLVDIQMPQMDGMETIRRLRQHPDRVIACAPIIAVTALAMTGDREKCLQAGANEYLSKPVVLKDLLALIKQWVKD